MAVDSLFTDGIIAAREKYLLKDKIVRMCEVSADEAFRMLVESGFGGGEAVSGVDEYERLVLADSRQIDDFIREFSPTKAASEYLLAPRDFHNAKALVKAEKLGTDADVMLAPDGMIPAEQLKNCFRTGDFSPLCGELLNAVAEAREYISSGGDSGAEIGAIFDKALYKHLAIVCKGNRLLKKFVADKADMTNILTAMRSKDSAFAEKYYVSGGGLNCEKLSLVFSDGDKAVQAFKACGKDGFLKLCTEAKAEAKPMTAAEKLLASYETDALSAHKYELKKNQPFLYYVFRRRAENENVRIVFACLLSGMPERQIKSRLRGVRE